MPCNVTEIVSIKLSCYYAYSNCNKNPDLIHNLKFRLNLLLTLLTL